MMGDGQLPSATELRGVLGRAKIVWAAYEAALTRAAAQSSGARSAVVWDLMAAVTAAHADMTQNLIDVYTALGLPFDPVIEVTDFEEIT